MAMTGAAVVSPLWPLFAALAIAGFYICLAPLLHLWPWSRAADRSHQPDSASHAVKANGELKTDRQIDSAQATPSERSLRSAAESQGRLFAHAARRPHPRPAGFVNLLFGHYRTTQYAPPLGHDQQGCVFRAVVAADCRPEVEELDTAIKDALADALSRSSLELWAHTQTGAPQGTTPTAWRRANPNSGQIVTFIRSWGTSQHHGSTLSAKATLELPSGPQFGPRPVLVLDVIEQTNPNHSDSPRLRLSLTDLHQFLHTIASTVVDELASQVFLPICGQATPRLLGPNYEINFGDRSLDTLLEIPRSFERLPDAYNNHVAEINTPEDSDPRDRAARDAVISYGMQKIFRSRGYDRIEPEIAKLTHPANSTAQSP